ncbi:lysophospholipid acyltransferase family protein [Aestuariivirga litoralis]|uniref:lysophospholipid acyltransferase family protein n=1 Tax=Aestuariivirga litoralis TaxID=2650924 RepID=UPI0018C48585|nr:lysophospholipid acyltransferase family protein [Aestuariivirga litoralis]MBG1233809.1 1-acyl-sn-glycerol-3-phosphate acyltransferase [Aestuariivirga litoralis]
MNIVFAVIKALAFVLLTLPLMPVQWLLLKIEGPFAKRLPHLYHRLVCKIIGLTLEIEGAMKSEGLLVANHTSWADIPVLSALHPVSFIAKKEVNTWPFFGSLARLQRTVFVNRERRSSTGESASEMLDRLTSGDTLVLFPEGTSHHGGWLKPFKSSFFGAVEGTDIPLIPVTVSYHRLNGLPLTLRQRHAIAWIGDVDLLPHLWDFLKGGPVSVKLTIHPALRPSDFKDRKTLSLAAQSVIGASLHFTA